MRKCNQLDQCLNRVLLIIAILSIASPARAQTTSTWTGLGANNLWNTPANWQGNTLPLSTNSTAVIFTGTTQTTAVLNAGHFDLNSLTFAAEAGPFTINQASNDFFNFLTPTSGVPLLPHLDQFSANPQTINFPNTGLQLNGDLLLGGTGNGSLTINGQMFAVVTTSRLILNGPYTVVLNTPLANTIAGITINAGTLRISTDGALGSGPLSFGGGTLRLTPASDYNTNRPISLGPAGGTLDVPSATIGFNGVISGTGGLTKTSPGHVGLLAANTYSGPTTVTGGFLDLIHNQAVQNSTINLNGGTLTFFSPATAPILGGLAGSGNLALASINSLGIGNNNSSTTYSGNLSGSVPGGLSKIGTGTWTLSGTNTLSGPLSIEAGTLLLGSASALSPNSTINLSAGATLDLNGFTCTPGAGTSNFSGVVRMQFGSIVANSGANITYSSATLTNGFLSGIGLQSITGGTTFNNITSFNGSQLTLQAASNLNLTNSTIGGSLTSNGALQWTNGTLASSGALTVNASANISGFENRGAIAINGTLTNSSSSLVSGGGSRITINPGGTLNVSTNALDLNGALLVNNGTITGTTNVNFGSVAKGGGVYGAVNVTDGGKFSPGNSPGSATTGSTTWNSGGSYIVEIADALAGPGIGWDAWNVNGALKLNATSTTSGRFTISLSTLEALAANFDKTHDYDWPILHAQDGLVGFDPSTLALDASGFKNNLGAGHFDLETTPTDLVIHFSSVPEPASIAFFVAAIALAYKRLRRPRETNVIETLE